MLALRLQEREISLLYILKIRIKLLRVNRICEETRLLIFII